MSITIRLLGGMGNQMFQLAYGTALRSRGYKVQYDRSALVEETHREYSLAHFANLPFGSPEGPVVTEKDMAFDATKLTPDDPSTMVGYWQSEKYFEDVQKEVRFLFSKSKANLQPNTIAIHVRRQDYVTLQHFHGLMPIDYYVRGLIRIQEKVGACPVVVFSDDTEWCLQNFPPEFLIIRTDNKYEDLRLMSSCDHAIIANSSFSWWGAWLQDNPNKIVVAPEKWFVDPTINTKDLVPEGWVRL